MEVFRQLNYLPFQFRTLVLKAINKKAKKKKRYICIIIIIINLHIFIKILNIFSGFIGKWVIFNRKYLKINVPFFLWKIWMLLILKISNGQFIKNYCPVSILYNFPELLRETLIRKTVSHNDQHNGVKMSCDESNVQKLTYFSWLSFGTSVEVMLF